MSADRNVLFVVSEYGEFFNLLGLAEDMSTAFDVHPVFLFKSDYGALIRHAETVELKGYSWVKEGDAKNFFDMSNVDLSVDDYVPFSTLNTAFKGLQTKTLRLLRFQYFLYMFVILPVKIVSAITYISILPIIFLIWISQKFLRFLRSYAVDLPTPSTFRSMVRIKGSIKARIRFAREIIRVFDPAIIISGQDYALSITSVMSTVGAESDVKTVIVPFSMTPTTKEIAETFAGLGLNRVRGFLYRRILQRTVPKWLHYYRGRYYLRLPLVEVLSAEINFLAPPQPWTPNSGRGIIMVPSQQGMDYCISAGIPETQLRLTGALWADDLLRRSSSRAERRAKLIRDVHINRTYWQTMRAKDFPFTHDADFDGMTHDNRKLLIFSWPPNQWPRKASGFATYDTFNIALMDMLAGLMHVGYANVVISLHPTLVGTDFAETIKSTGLYVTDADLIDIIDCADLFCATVSSTLLWSLCLGIPSVNFDIYRYGYREFKQAGLEEAVSLRQLRDQLTVLIQDRDAYDEVKSKMSSVSDYWTVRDGKSRERVLAEISDLMRKSRSRGKSSGAMTEFLSRSK